MTNPETTTKATLRAFAAAVVSLCALALAPAAAADTRLGINDDAAKFAEGAPLFFETMTSLGLTENVMTVRWDPSRPGENADGGFLASALPVARRHGVEVVLDVYPAQARAFAADPTAPSRFAGFVQRLALGNPDVLQFIVMNECNQPRFLQPQFSGTRVVSAAICGQALALTYDALKAVDPELTIWGVGLSPRGNDDPAARSNVSTSPVRFLDALGRWYRGSGRRRPLMDGLAFHPYPNSNRDAFALGYGWPNAGAVNLDRLYQAFWDAFRGSAQPTFAEGSAPDPGAASLSLNEIGIQVATTGDQRYLGAENIPAVGQAAQAEWYAQLLSSVVCDPRVASVNFFHLIDEPQRPGFQSGLFGLDWQRRYAADVVQFASRSCQGAARSWRHSARVAGAAATFVGLRVEAHATEDAGFTAGVIAVGRTGANPSEVQRALTSRRTAVRAVSTAIGRLPAYRRARLQLLPPLGTGCWQLGITFRALLNPERASTFVGPVTCARRP